MSDNLPRYHYFRLPGETEPNRLRRLIDHFSKYRSGQADFWQLELQRLEDALNWYEYGVAVVGHGEGNRCYLRGEKGRIWIEIDPESPHVEAETIAEIEYRDARWKMRYSEEEIIGKTPKKLAQDLWTRIAIERKLRAATVNDEGKMIDVEDWDKQKKHPS